MPKRNSLLLVTESYWPTIDGGALFQRRLAHALKARGWTVHVWAPSPTGKLYIEDDHGVAIVRDPSRVLRSNPRYKVSYCPFTHHQQVFRLAKPDIVHVHNFGPLGLTATSYARTASIPVVATNHNHPRNWTANFLRFSTPEVEYLIAQWFSWLLNHAKFVVSPSSTADRYLRDIGVSTERTIISNGVDVNFFQPAERASHRRQDATLRLAHIGRLDREKSCRVVINAAAQASLARSLSLRIAGDGVQRVELQRLARSLESVGRATPGAISFEGQVNEFQKRAILQSSDLFVTASEVELQSISVMEAMACGTGALAPKAGALPELVRPGTTGYLFQPGQADDCARQLVETDLKSLREIGRNARRMVLSEHCAESSYEKYDLLLKRVIAPK